MAVLPGFGITVPDYPTGITYTSTGPNSGNWSGVDTSATNPLWAGTASTGTGTGTGTGEGYVDPAKAYYDWLRGQQEAERAAQLNRDIEAAKTFFSTYGLMDLWNGAYSYLTQGYTDPSQIAIMLSNNSQYQQAYYARFPAVQKIREINKTRAAQGLPPIAEPLPGTYVQLEQGYRQALSGLPDGVFGTAEDMADWIAGEVSVQEIADRVAVAKNYINYQANTWVKDALRQAYGLTDTEMVAYVLDQNRTQSWLETDWQRRMAGANVAGAANASGFVADQAQLDAISQTAYGSSFDAAMGGFRNVQEQQAAYMRLGNIYNADTTTSELVTENFGLGGAAEVTTKKSKLASAERAAFGGSSAIARTSLSARRSGQQ